MSGSSQWRMPLPRSSSRPGVLVALAVACAWACHGENEPVASDEGDSTSDAAAGGGLGGASVDLSGCDEIAPGERRLRRLTPREYDHTIADLLGVASRFGQAFPADVVVDGFANHADALQVSPLLADKLQDAAEALAQQADLERLLPCAEGQGEAACAHGFIAEFGLRAFRRPFSSQDIDRYLALFEEVSSQGDASFDAAIRWVIAAMLQSPHFLYRAELGAPDDAGRYVLDDYEIASQLSYLLWQTMPDEALFQAAAAGQLRELDQIQAQARRMLADPRARQMLRHFVMQWLELEHLESVPKDAASFPELSDAIRVAMRAEVERLVDHVLDQSGSLTELLTTTESFVSPELAGFYALAVGGSPDAHGQHHVDLIDEGRSGLLTRGAVMLQHARSNDSSPIHRGKLVRERLFCQTPPPPPPGIVVDLPGPDPSLTTRERFAAHSEQEPCQSCHRLLDPIGFAFEHFDGVGRHREDDQGHPIDVSGEILGSPSSDGPFVGTLELAQILAQSRDVQDCFALQFFRFAYGASHTPQTSCLLGEVQQRFRDSELSIEALVQALIESVHLRARVAAQALGEDSEGDGLPGDRTGGSPAEPPAPDPGQAPPEDTPRDSLPDGELQVEIVEEQDWGQGYCHTLSVTNTGDDSLTWQLERELDGQLTNHWEAIADAAQGTVRFTGAAHNATLEPGQSARFGYCAER